jgi:hypothetical protein
MHMQNPSRGPAWNDAARVFALQPGQEMKIKEDRDGCNATGRPVYAVFIRNAGAPRGRRVGSLFYAPGVRCGHA